MLTTGARKPESEFLINDNVAGIQIAQKKKKNENTGGARISEEYFQVSFGRDLSY